MALSSGTKIGPYEVLSSIGAGGMGEVYLAQDSRLRRKVALKLITDRVASNEQARSRFLKEARAASSLNNPHIVAIYDIINQDHSDVIVMEYMEGESLRKLLSRGKLEIKRAFEIAAGVASALAAAHNAGIIHRDIKPENILITRTNVTKVLDFGLAKQVTAERDAEASQLTTAFETVEGAILGTVPYMSPEQAEGKTVDHRTDIFSLGAVLFEMLTGNRPFQGNSSIETLHAILHHDPLTPLQTNGSLPKEILDLLARALAKNPEERYQHAGDFALDLRKLKNDIHKNLLPGSHAQFAKQSNVWKYLFLVSMIGVAFLGFALWKLKHPVTLESPDAGFYQKFTLTPLTVDPGYEWGPTFSPDGETIAYVSDRTGNFDIFLKQISGGPDINLTNHKADEVQPAFSPDGKQIAFVSTRSSDSDLHYPGLDTPLSGGDIWVMPALGGSPRRIVENANFPSWSPDGSHILYVSGSWSAQKVYTIPASGGTPKEIPIRLPASSTGRLLYPVYSPSGNWILFSANKNIHLLNVKNGKTEVILRGTCPAWLGPDKIVFSNADPGKNFSLWEASFSEKEGKIFADSRPLTLGRGRDLYASPSKDGSRVAFASVDFTSNLEVMPFDADSRGQTGEPRSITAGNDLIYFANFSPDARQIAFGSQRGSSSHIWRTDSDSGVVQLTSDPKYFDDYPRYSPDGKQIAFGRKESNNLDAKNEVWLMAGDGANPQPLLISPKGVIGFFAWLPSGKALVYRSDSDGQLYRFDIASKTQHRITNEDRTMPVVGTSSDGQWIVYQSTMRGSVDVRAVRAQGGEARFVASTPHHDYHPLVSPSGKWLYFEKDHKNLYRVPGPGQNWVAKEPEKITNFPESGLFIEDPQISQDGKQLLYSRAKITGDIWILNLAK